MIRLLPIFCFKDLEKMINVLDRILVPGSKSVSFPADAWEKIRKLAASFPPLSGGGVEYHLGSNPTQMDMFVRASKVNYGPETLAGCHSTWHLSPKLLQNSAWQRIRSFSSHWADPQTEMFHAIENAWLEFDIAPLADLQAIPSISFDLDRQQILTPDKREEILMTALDALEFPVPTNFYPSLRSYLGKLPPNAFLYFVGAMIARPTNAVRVCLVGLKKNQLFPYLDSIGWEGQKEKLEQIIHAYLPNPHKLILNIDLSPTPNPKISVEYFTANKYGWKDYLPLLIQAGLCSEEEAQFILHWSNIQEFPKDEFQQSLSEAMGKEIKLLLRRINHIKLVCPAEGDIKAKAYLYFGYF